MSQTPWPGPPAPRRLALAGAVLAAVAGCAPSPSPHSGHQQPGWGDLALLADATPSAPDNGQHAAPDGAAPTDLATPLDQTASPAQDVGPADGSAWPALLFNVILRQAVQPCSGCGWLFTAGNTQQRPRLVVKYRLGNIQTTRSYQYGVAGEENAWASFISSKAAENSGNQHQLLIKKSPARSGLLRVDLSDIPPDATIEGAALHLHFDEKEGIANADASSVIAVHQCPRAWSWEEASWTHFADKKPWTTPGGDFGPLIRELRAKQDVKDRGFSKANPNVDFDFTAYIGQLQAQR